MLRIKNLRWEFGTVLPEEIKYNLCEQEVKERVLGSLHAHGLTGSQRSNLLGQIILNSLRSFFALTNNISTHVNK